MGISLKDLKYSVGSAGMVATASYRHSRGSSMSEELWTNKTASTNFPYGYGAFVDPNGDLCMANVANAKFVGVFQDPQTLIGKNYYAPKDKVLVCTLGDIWVKLAATNLSLKLSDAVYCLTAGANAGTFTNASGADRVQIPYARFISSDAGGIAILSLAAWAVPNA
jgi:hypothetical protein